MDAAISSKAVQILKLGLIMISTTEWLTLLADSIELIPSINKIIMQT